MKKIGEGYYYNVYDLGNGRVLKKLKNKFQMFWFIWKKNIKYGTTFSEYHQARKNIPNIELMYEEIKNKKESFEFLGNPIFLDGINYEQDKTVIISDFFKKSSIEKSKQIVKKYIESIKRLWEFGMCEKVFNFTINNGIDKNGNVILIDFNEISFDHAEAKNRIETKRWLRSWSCRMLSADLKSFYESKMNEEMTVENLEMHWNKSVLK